MDITAVNGLSYEEFVDIFGNVVEKCPIVAAAVWSERPFRCPGALEAAFNDFIDLLPQSGFKCLDFSSKLINSMPQTPFYLLVHR